jgi:hypothetical protein
MRKYIKTILFMISITLAAITYSQPLPNGDPGGNGDVPVGGQVPINGGLPVLLLAGIAYVVICKYQKTNLKKETEQEK